MHGCQVRFLLMGGQACVLYGGSEFSRDTDLVILPEAENLEKLSAALKELNAEKIAVPDLSIALLQKGHAVHFRCKHPDALDMRIDVMSVLRNAPSFESLWQRRTSMELSDGIIIEIVSLPDLIAIKKTQRDKDWSHIRRLIEADYFENRDTVSKENIRFWLSEARTPGILRSLAVNYFEEVRQLQSLRPLLKLLPDCTDEILSTALLSEEKQYREADRAYWLPLLAELEKIRHER
jgi:hypothetical protein